MVIKAPIIDKRQLNIAFIGSYDKSSKSLNTCSNLYLINVDLDSMMINDVKDEHLNIEKCFEKAMLTYMYYLSIMWSKHVVKALSLIESSPNEELQEEPRLEDQDGKMTS